MIRRPPRSPLDRSSAASDVYKSQVEILCQEQGYDYYRGGLHDVLDRYYQAFEAGDLDPGQFKTRLSELEAKLGTLHEQERTLAARLADPAEGFDPQALARVADRLRDTLAAGEPEQTKALLRLLIKELRVNGRSEILPTYRVVAPEVCATTSSVGAPGIEPGTSRV